MGRPEAFDELIAYLWWLLRPVDEAIRLGLRGTGGHRNNYAGLMFSRVTVQSGLASQFVNQELSSLEYFVDLSGVR